MAKMNMNNLNNFIGTGGTHKGNLRSQNEDSYMINNRMGLFAVADGVGGNGSGKIASKFAIDEFNRLMVNTDLSHTALDTKQGIKLIEQINSALNLHKIKISYSDSLATTFTSLIINTDQDGLLLHAGDSRLYGLDHSGTLVALTSEHTLASELNRQGHKEIDATASDALLNCIGHTRPELHESVIVPLQNYQAFLLCSDGLNKMVKHEQVERIVSKYSQQPEMCVKLLIEAALAAGGYDNITTIIICRK
ncbi:MAG: serine/threonine-protein phosphatase [Candidatus Marinimicrobia bacterium]|nr:serine/threonine-protein phosphatase [Candidatus Neomarinimicrobiota bacterium]